jgi:hypothetical protein
MHYVEYVVFFKRFILDILFSGIRSLFVRSVVEVCQEGANVLLVLQNSQARVRRHAETRVR